MGHHHHHGHDHSHHNIQAGSFNAAFVVAISLNLIFTGFEASYALIANSMGLLADAAHNLGDVLGLVMAWGANLLLKRTATPKYSYGYKKTTILAALANALLLVFTSAIIMYESINKLIYSAPLDEWIVIIVALIGIVINGGTALLFMRGRDQDINIKGAFLHLAYDALIAAGVVVAGIIILYTNWVWLDPVIGLIIVTVILWGTWALLRQSVDLILGAVPHGINQQEVKNYLQNIPGVQTVHDLHIWGLSTQETALTAHLIMPNQVLSDADYERINHDLHHHFNINHVTIQVEKGEEGSACKLLGTC